MICDICENKIQEEPYMWCIVGDGDFDLNFCSEKCFNWYLENGDEKLCC